MSVGESLAEARRRSGLTVADVSRKTCIRKAIIDSIERGDYSACGGDFYARGHIRALARAAGADPGPLIADFDAARRGGAVKPAGLPRQPDRPRWRRRPGWAALRRRARAAGSRLAGRAARLARGGPVRRPAMAGPRRAWHPGMPGPGRGRPAARRFGPRLAIVVVTGALVLAGLVVAGVTGSGGAGVPARPGVAWTFSAASNTVAIRLTSAGGPSGRRVLARSRLVVSEDQDGGPSRQSGGGGTVDVHVRPGNRTRLLVRVEGPEPSTRALTVTAPPALRVVASRRDPGGLVVSVSGPLRRPPRRLLCGRDAVSLPGSREVAVASGPGACRARLRLTDAQGERATVAVHVPGLPQAAPVYSFAHPAGRAIYLTIDDGWTPSRPVLALIRRTHVPLTAFLIQDAARQHLAYWRAFVRAGGQVGDHTVSHPNLTTLTLAQATAQWAGARRALGRWLGQVPILGRPPYGAFDHAVQAAACRAGLPVLVGWSVIVDSDGIHTWNGHRLEPGEIVLLHWVPGLGSQLARLLTVIHARHLVPRPLTPASFTGMPLQRHSLNGD